jgi:hypothetical protein
VLFYVYLILSIIFAIISAAYLQLPTFILSLGYGWFHNYKTKRWIFRLLSIIFSILLIETLNSVIISVLVNIPNAFLLFFSLVNANPKVYISLSEENILKLRETDYPKDTEVLGYRNEKGNSICYPLHDMIKPRHILNDTFQSNPLLITYCMACRSAMVYNPTVNELKLTFDVLGVYRRNMIMMDRETGTVWQQGTGEAVFGKLKGTQLMCLPYQQTKISDWLAHNQDSFIALESKAVKDGIFSKERLMKMMKVTESLVAPGKTNLFGLGLRDPIFGIEMNGLSKAYPVSELKKKNKFTDKLGKIELTINYDVQTNFIVIMTTKTQILLSVQSHWWFGWKEFHPNTEIWNSTNYSA